MHFIDEFVSDELKELESRDVDTLFECIRENLVDMEYPFDEEYLYREIERQLKGVTK